jgi:hypothetical protein
LPGRDTLRCSWQYFPALFDQPDDEIRQSPFGLVLHDEDLCERRDSIIRMMTEITQNRTKEYVSGSDILDIDGSAG